MEPIFVVYRVVVDPAMNLYSDALSYKLIGYLKCQEAVDKLFEGQTKIVGTGWPIIQGKEIDEYKVVETRCLNTLNIKPASDDSDVSQTLRNPVQ